MGSVDERPPVAVGHVLFATKKAGEAAEFLVRVGLRSILLRPEFAVLELRGGTHIIVQETDGEIAEGTDAPFDLMVDDIDATHKGYAELGCEPTAIERGKIHDSFKIREPGGHDITINSSHASDLPI